MKIAFYSYPSAFQNPGGGEVQLLKTKQALENKGVTVKLFDQWQDKLESFDILHVFGSVKDCLGLISSAKNKKVKIVLSTIFWSSFRRAFFESNDFKARLELSLRHLAKLCFPYFPSTRRKLMLLSDILLPNSRVESDQLMQLFGMPKEKIFVVPNGVDERFASANKEQFSKKYGFRDFILTVGRIEPRKNQLNLIRAVNTLNYHLVIIGNPVSDYPDYYKACKEIAGKNIHFLEGLDHEDQMFSSAYAACSVFVAPGWFETPSLAALEAGLCGARLALTSEGCTKEYFLGHAEYFDPADKQDIAAAIKKAYSRDKDESLKQYIQRYYTWDKVAESTIAAYEKVLK